MTTGPLRADFQRDDSERQPILERVRTCVALCDPSLLPPLGQEANSELPTSFQSMGARGLSALEGGILLSTFPPNIPWHRLNPSAMMLLDPAITPDIKQRLVQRLYERQVLAESVLHSAHTAKATKDHAAFDAAPRSRASFYARKRTALRQVIATGDTLEQLTDSYRIKVFRRDQYVTRRDSCGDVLYHIVKESIDPLSLSDTLIAKANLKKADLEAEKSVQKRMVDLYTRVQWSPVKKTWVVCQEINEKEIVEAEEKITQFLSTPWKLAPGEHYGRGFIEENLGDLLSFDNLSERLLDFAALASKHLLFKDYASEVRNEELSGKTGKIVRGRVQGGMVQDVALFKADKLNDFNVVHQTHQSLRKDLGAAMLLESEVTPRGERVTATQVQRVAAELQAATGGASANIQDHQQVPLLDRLYFQLERDKLLPTLPDGVVEYNVLTGFAALAQSEKTAGVLSFAQAVAGLGPTAMARIDESVLVSILARATRIDEPGLVKSEEQMKAQAKANEDQAARMAATDKGIEVLGDAAATSLSGTGT